jgi:hypothetical protein
MDFTITIDDTLVPGIIATANLEGKDPEDVVAEYAESVSRKACQDLKVGPYYTGPIPPQFNADGSPYIGVAQEEEPVPPQEEEVVPQEEEPALETNDTTPPVEEEV